MRVRFIALLPLVSAVWQNNGMETDLGLSEGLWESLDQGEASVFKRCDSEMLSKCYLDGAADCAECAVTQLPKHILKRAQNLLAMYDFDGDNRISAEEAERVVAMNPSKVHDEVLMATMRLYSGDKKKGLDFKGIVNHVSPDFCNLDISLLQVSSSVSVNGTSLIEKSSTKKSAEKSQQKKTSESHKTKHKPGYPSFQRCKGNRAAQCLICWESSCASCGVALVRKPTRGKIINMLKKFDGNKDYEILRGEILDTLSKRAPKKAARNIGETNALMFYDNDMDGVLSLSELVNMVEAQEHQEERHYSLLQKSSTVRKNNKDTPEIHDTKAKSETHAHKAMSETHAHKSKSKTHAHKSKSKIQAHKSMSETHTHKSKSETHATHKVNSTTHAEKAKPETHKSTRKKDLPVIKPMKLGAWKTDKDTFTTNVMAGLLCPDETIVSCLTSNSLGKECRICALQYSEGLSGTVLHILKMYDSDTDYHINYQEISQIVHQNNNLNWTEDKLVSLESQFEAAVAEFDEDGDKLLDLPETIKFMDSLHDWKVSNRKAPKSLLSDDEVKNLPVYILNFMHDLHMQNTKEPELVAAAPVKKQCGFHHCTNSKVKSCLIDLDESCFPCSLAFMGNDLQHETMDIMRTYDVDCNDMISKEEVAQHVVRETSSLVEQQAVMNEIFSYDANGDGMVSIAEARGLAQDRVNLINEGKKLIQKVDNIKHIGRKTSDAMKTLLGTMAAAEKKKN